jgi:LysM repeat protein
MHRVKNGQSLFALSQFYNLSVGDLQAANGLTEPSVKSGQVLRLPIHPKVIVKKRPEPKKMGEFVPVYYRVREKETLYKIGKEYFRTPVDTLMQRNRLKNEAVATGKVLLVGWFPKAGVPEDIQNGFHSEAQKNYLELKNKFELEKAGKKVVVQEGAAVWQKEDRKANDAAFLARFESAPVGSILEVSNPGMGATVYVKVVAPMPRDAKTGNAIIWLSPAAAKALGARDEKFYVKIHSLK